jgi:hypothetical protein
MLHFLAPLPEQAEPASQQFTDHPDNTREMRQTPVLLAPASPSCGALNRNSTGNLLKKRRRPDDYRPSWFRLKDKEDQETGKRSAVKGLENGGSKSESVNGSMVMA